MSQSRVEAKSRLGRHKFDPKGRYSLAHRAILSLFHYKRLFRFVLLRAGQDSGCATLSHGANAILVKVRGRTVHFTFSHVNSELMLVTEILKYSTALPCTSTKLGTPSRFLIISCPGSSGWVDNLQGMISLRRGVENRLALRYQNISAMQENVLM